MHFGRRPSRTASLSTAGLSAQFATNMPLGMAATFQLAESHPNPNAQATGTIQFAPNDAQALQLNACLLSACTSSITIMNVTPQGTTVYTLSDVRLTSAAIGQTTTIGFNYWAAQWQTFAPGSSQASQSGTM